MIRFNITYEDSGAITITSTDMDSYEYNIEKYNNNTNWYDICDCLKDFISKHIEEKE